ncbi:MAG: hypothetical protein RLZZ15_3139, partial [Verrucomicrobiota bacterium]
TGAAVAADIGQLVATLDQPTGDGVNTYYVSRAARAGGVTVALSGLGGDELFGGYPSFQTTPRLARWLPFWWAMPAPLRSGIVSRLRQSDTRHRKLADVLAHARTLHEVGAMQRRVFAEVGVGALLSRDVQLAAAGRTPFHPALAGLAADLGAADPFETVSAWELRTYMADVLLRDSDVMSMRHSLELRVPFVDRGLIEWLWRQPAAFKSDPRHAKRALAAAAHDVLPPGLAERRKRGFSLPFPTWMKRELRPFLDETFSDASVERAGWFARGEPQKLWRGYLAGHDTREWSRVWTLAMLIAFSNRGRRSAPAGSAAPVTLASPAAPAIAPSLPGRTLLLAPEIFASEGGIPRILQTYLKAVCELTAPGGSVRLLALNDAVIGRDDTDHYGTPALVESVACARSKSRFVREALRLARHSDRIICGHVFQLPVAWLARRLNPRLRYYLVAHGIEVWRAFSATEKVALRGAEKIFCVSDFTRGELLKNCPLPPGRAVVLPNALDPWFAIGPGVPLAQCAPDILVVTRLTYADRYKGIEHMIAAMPAVRAAIPGATLHLVGRGDDVPRLTALRDGLALGDAVRFHGFVDDATLAARLRSCRLFALPSKKEGFGLVFLEAMAHGRPCLGARAGGIPEVITEETGVMVDYGDVPGTAAACIAALRREWDENAILDRARHFSYSQFTRRLAAVLPP